MRTVDPLPSGGQKTTSALPAPAVADWNWGRAGAPTVMALLGADGGPVPLSLKAAAVKV